MAEQTKRTWRIDLTDEQFRCIINGMEFYHRMMCGEISELRNITPNHRAIEKLVPEIKHAMFPELDKGQTYGWNGGHPDPWFDREQAQSYQVYREMEHQWTLREHKGEDYNVYSSETLKSGKALPIIVKQI